MANEIDIKKLPVTTLDVPAGENVKEFLENYLGTLPTDHSEMPEDADVDSTVFVKLG